MVGALVVLLQLGRQLGRVGPVHANGCTAVSAERGFLRRGDSRAPAAATPLLNTMELVVVMMLVGTLVLLRVLILQMPVLVFWLVLVVELAYDQLDALDGLAVLAEPRARRHLPRGARVMVDFRALAFALHPRIN